MEQDDNQFILNEGRLMTLGQLKQELAHNQQENINVHQSVITNQRYVNHKIKLTVHKMNNCEIVACKLVLINNTNNQHRNVTIIGDPSTTIQEEEKAKIEVAKTVECYMNNRTM